MASLNEFPLDLDTGWAYALQKYESNVEFNTEEFI